MNAKSYPELVFVVFQTENERKILSSKPSARQSNKYMLSAYTAYLHRAYQHNRHTTFRESILNYFIEVIY
jgi:hypothetical protein